MLSRLCKFGADVWLRNIELFENGNVWLSPDLDEHMHAIWTHIILGPLQTGLKALVWTEHQKGILKFPRAGMDMA